MDIIIILQVLAVLFFHWIADFLFQTTYMGTYKGKSKAVLTTHVVVYTITMTWLMAIAGFFPHAMQLFAFAGLVFIFHWLTDFATSRLTGPQFEKKKYNGFTGAFTIIGFDQFLHFAQLLTILYTIQHYV